MKTIRKIMEGVAAACISVAMYYCFLSGVLCRENRENCLYDPGWNILYFCLGGRSGDIMVCEMASQTEQRTGKYDKDFA